MAVMITHEQAKKAKVQKQTSNIVKIGEMNLHINN